MLRGFSNIRIVRKKKHRSSDKHNKTSTIKLQKDTSEDSLKAKRSILNMYKTALGIHSQNEKIKKSLKNCRQENDKVCSVCCGTDGCDNCSSV